MPHGAEALIRPDGTIPYVASTKDCAGSRLSREQSVNGILDFSSHIWSVGSRAVTYNRIPRRYPSD
jgi:hypothetical protein